MKLRKNKMKKWIITCGCILGSTLVTGTLVPCLTSQGGGNSQPTIATPNLTAIGDNNHDFGTGQILLNGAQSTLPNLGVGYLDQNYAITNTVPSLPDNTIVTYGITSSNASYFSIVNGVNATLTLRTGLAAGQYNFTMSCVLQHSGYNTSTFYSYFTLNVVDNNPFPSNPNPTYNGATTMASQTFDESTTLTYSYTLDIASNQLPNGTIVTFAKPVVGAVYYTINSTTNTLTITNNENSHPLYSGNYTIPIQITLDCPGYVQKTYTVNATFTITPKTTQSQVFNVTDALTALYTINAGTTLYYQATTSAVWGNKFIDLYQYALNNGADITQQITFHITASLTSGLLIDPRLKNVVIDAPTAQTIKPTITGANNQNACGILIASATSNAVNAIGFTNTLNINNANLSLVMDYVTSNPDWYGAAYGFVANVIGTGANISLGISMNIRELHVNPVGIYFNGAISGATSITIDTRTLVVYASGLSSAGAAVVAYGVLFGGAIAGASLTSLASITFQSANTNSIVQATGEANGIMFNSTINNANVTFAASTKISVQNNYRGQVFGLRFVGAINGTQDAKTTINIDGTYDVNSTVSGYIPTAGNATAIHVNAGMTSWSTTNCATFSVNKNATLNVTTNNIGYGINIVGVISSNSIVTLNGNIRVINDINGISGSIGVQVATVAGTVNIGALLYMFISAYVASTVYGINIVTGISLGGVVTFSGVMSINVFARTPSAALVLTVYGVRCSGFLDNGASLIVTGIINIMNGDPTLANGASFSVGVSVSGLCTGIVKVGGTTAQPACINLQVASTGTAGSTYAIQVTNAEVSAQLQTANLYINMNGRLAAGAQFFNSGTYGFKGTMAITTATTIVYSYLACTTWNTGNYSTSIYTIIWNANNMQGGNSTATGTAPSPNALITAPIFLNAAATNVTNLPNASTNFSFALNPYKVNATDDSLYFNQNLRKAFMAWYTAQAYASGSTGYTWCNSMNSAAVGSAGWNAHT